MRTKQRHLRKEFTWGLIVIELLSFLLLLIVLSIDFSVTATTMLFQFEYFLIVCILMLITYYCHKLLDRYGNKQVMNIFIEKEDN